MILWALLGMVAGALLAGLAAAMVRKQLSVMVNSGEAVVIFRDADHYTTCYTPGRHYYVPTASQAVYRVSTRVQAMRVCLRWNVGSHPVDLLCTMTYRVAEPVQTVGYASVEDVLENRLRIMLARHSDEVRGLSEMRRALDAEVIQTEVRTSMSQVLNKVGVEVMELCVEACRAG